ncbi:MAG: DUF1579 domain-containing protein [Chloroflexi bacterium]|nr:DUF1579 domain-containing protein [Chloroflexota bacterium]
MHPEPTPEHAWLQRLVGEWTYETVNPMDTGPTPTTFTGTETIRPLGGLWIVAEGRSETPGGSDERSLLTFGYNPQTERFVSTWIGSMMAHLWVCEGTLDAAGTVLTLECTGPSFEGTGKRTAFRDVVEVRGDDHRFLRAYMQLDSGEWLHLMTSEYRRRS